MYNFPFQSSQSYILLICQNILIIKDSDNSFRCSPSPGSYPVQAYAPASMFVSQAIGNAPSSEDGWSHSTIMQQNYTVPSLNLEYSTVPNIPSNHGHTHGHDCGHSHGHSHEFQTGNFWMPKAPYSSSQFSPPKNMTVEPFDNPSHVTA